MLFLLPYHLRFLSMNPLYDYGYRVGRQAAEQDRGVVESRLVYRSKFQPLASNFKVQGCYPPPRLLPRHDVSASGELGHGVVKVVLQEVDHWSTGVIIIRVGLASSSRHLPFKFLDNDFCPAAITREEEAHGRSLLVKFRKNAFSMEARQRPRHYHNVSMVTLRRRRMSLESQTAPGPSGHFFVFLDATLHQDGNEESTTGRLPPTPLNPSWLIK
ncbi:uncharacterized protein ARMOST_15542 [Armillaria ostoyae]|uniref:Uncharacterized protein n=1 Tax=Armillaria ostoyae TaxID=47428 RepID=A0A284RTK5_ARMOS|nr:uncharacterized protein ARMOST_15542 [Armillaria ostoyae]